MNRPFQAFGALLILLALAMLAVNSGSRTTMFDRPPPKAKAYLPPRNSRLGGVYVVVLPAPETELGIEGMPDLTELLDSDLAGEELAVADDRTLYDADYDRAMFGDSGEKMGPTRPTASTTEIDRPVRSGQWLLRFAASSLNQLGRACEAAARQLEQAESESVASKAELPPR